MEGLLPRIIVTAVGAGTLGGPEALRLLVPLAGQSPVLDIAICVLVIGMVTAHLLGVVLLVRFVRKARVQAGAGGGAAPRPRALATDCFAKMTLMVSVGIAFLVTACLVVVSGGLMSSARLVFDIAGKSNVVAGVLVCIMPLLHVLRQARNAGGGAPATRATERLAGMTRTAYLTGLCLVVGICLLLFISFVEPGGLGALCHFYGFTDMFVGVASDLGWMGSREVDYDL